jgi:hypothetical protein
MKIATSSSERSSLPVASTVPVPVDTGRGKVTPCQASGLLESSAGEKARKAAGEKEGPCVAGWVRISVLCTKNDVICGSCI